jgi:sn-glycerol 3-phosphate transport system substrate-binding protein
MFTLDRRGRDRSFRSADQDAEDQAWAQGLLSAFMENSQTGGKTVGHFRSSARRSSSTTTRNVQGSRLDPIAAPNDWKEMLAYARSSPSATASGKVTQVGRADSVVGLSVLAVPGLTTENGVQLANSAGTETYYDKPEVIEALQYWDDLCAQVQGAPEGIVEWGTTPKDFFEKKMAMMWTTTGILTNVKTNAKFDFGVAMLPRTSAAGSLHRRRQLLSVQARRTPRSRRRRSGSSNGSPRRSARRNGASTPATSRCARCLGHAGDEAVRRGFPAAAVARDQLQFAVAELSTHDNQRVTKALNDGLQAR